MSPADRRRRGDGVAHRTLGEALDKGEVLDLVRRRSARRPRPDGRLRPPRGAGTAGAPTGALRGRYGSLEHGELAWLPPAGRTPRPRWTSRGVRRPCRLTRTAASCWSRIRRRRTADRSPRCGCACGRRQRVHARRSRVLAQDLLGPRASRHARKPGRRRRARSAGAEDRDDLRLPERVEADPGRVAGRDRRPGRKPPPMSTACTRPTRGSRATGSPACLTRGCGIPTPHRPPPPTAATCRTPAPRRRPKGNVHGGLPALHASARCDVPGSRSLRASPRWHPLRSGRRRAR